MLACAALVAFGECFVLLDAECWMLNALFR